MSPLSLPASTVPKQSGVHRGQRDHREVSGDLQWQQAEQGQCLESYSNRLAGQSDGTPSQAVEQFQGEFE